MINIKFPLIKLILSFPAIILTLLSIFLVNIISILLLSILFFVIIEKILLSIEISIVIILVINHRLIFETFETVLDNFIMSLVLSPIIIKYQKQNESFYTSREINVENRPYRVIRFGKAIIPQFSKREMQPLSGYIVLDAETFEVMKDIELINKVLRIFKLWFYIYIHPIFGKNFREDKRSLKNHLQFQINFVKNIQSNKINNYTKVRNKYGEEYTNVLKILDEEVIAQSPLLIEKLKLGISILDKIFDIFTKPSDLLYSEILSSFNKIEELSVKENEIWVKRLNSWDKLKGVYDKKIENLPEPSATWPLMGVTADIIDVVYFKNPPALGSTIVATFAEIGKVFLKYGGKYFVDIILYHKFGIDAIRKNIDINNNISELVRLYNSLLENDDIDKVRM